MSVNFGGCRATDSPVFGRRWTLYAAVVCHGFAVFAFLPSAFAQAPAADANRVAPQSRAGQIDMERRRKWSVLQPDTPSGIEQGLNYIKEHRIIERITAGIAGFRVHLGGLTTGSGFAVGPEYYRRGLAHEQIRIRASARASLKKFYLMDFDFEMPRLAGNHLFVDFYGLHRNYPHIDYYGPGSGSSKNGRTGFLLEDTSFQAMAGVKPVEFLRFGAIGRYLTVNISRGRDERFASTDRVFTEATTPGLQLQSNFLEGGGFFQLDWRDYPGEPRRGGNYLAKYTTYTDTLRGRFSFSRLDLEVQQYIGFFNDRRVIALRGRIEATHPHDGNLVPFYLQPTLGGSEDLRGYRPFRFYDNNSAVLNGEYRWEIFSGLDMALFVDAGNVFHRARSINFRDLKTDYGFGFRFNVRNNVFLRIDTGFSNEGFQTWVKFGNVF